MRKFLVGLVVCITGLTSGLSWAGDEKGMARRVEMLEKQVAALHAEVKRLNGNTVLKLNHAVDLQNVDGQPTAIFSGINLQVVNGTGDQFTLNGRGNLTVGYTSPRTFGDPICSDGAFLTQSDCESNRKIWGMHHTSGSHNLLLGTGNSYSNQGAIIGGSHNAVNAPSSSILGGWGNVAGAIVTSILGGGHNTAIKEGATMSGGLNNRGEGFYSSLGGGVFNTTNGDHSVVSAGAHNQTTGAFSTVSGGTGNLASGDYAVVSGGGSNTASGVGSSVTGFANITAIRDWATCPDLNYCFQP